jgi:hypothetical protein
MWIGSLAHFLVGVLAAIFAVAGIGYIAGSGYLRERLGHPVRYYRVIGVLQLFAALFLAVSQLRIWGIVLAGLMTFFWVVGLFNHRQWNWALAGMLMLMALAPASLAIH